MKTKFTMMMAVIATFAISLNLHSSNEEVVFGAPAVQMPRGVKSTVLSKLNGKIAKWLLQAQCVSVKMVNAAPE